jgi:hypothetical protein
MITCNIREATIGYGALRRIAQTTLPQKGAWRVARLINKIKAVVVEFEETQTELFLNAGAVRTQAGVELPELVREDHESDIEWGVRVDRRRQLISTIHSEIEAARKKEVEIDYDPIPTTLFEKPGKKPEEEVDFSANDFADAAPFLTEA